jgi:hypothetical protein
MMFTFLFGLLSNAMFINKIHPSSCSFYFENLKYNNVLLFFSRVFFFLDLGALYPPLGLLVHVSFKWKRLLYIHNI